jgi:hypothetical protein
MKGIWRVIVPLIVIPSAMGYLIAEGIVFRRVTGVTDIRNDYVFVGIFAVQNVIGFLILLKSEAIVRKKEEAQRSILDGRG